MKRRLGVLLFCSWGGAVIQQLIWLRSRSLSCTAHLLYLYQFLCAFVLLLIPQCSQPLFLIYYLRLGTISSIVSLADQQVHDTVLLSNVESPNVCVQRFPSEVSSLNLWVALPYNLELCDLLFCHKTKTFIITVPVFPCLHHCAALFIVQNYPYLVCCLSK